MRKDCKHDFGPVLNGAVKICDKCKAILDVETFDIYTKDMIKIFDGLTGEEAKE